MIKNMIENLERAENFLHGFGIEQPKIAYVDNIVMIAVKEEYFGLILQKRDEITKNFEQLGFNYIALDLDV